ncbi:hypothetical protein PHYSODRAFT_262821 [Phytophthora sojae]|uniref:Uncharacterized protein n=1 Tax=Phytophthora sojae (strain P6497) TaxID=1094619 RepID=G4ZUY7_PHYSP|nr:hypothetical protein PHYSODRAFT_262821 [Phytophthora sojae]EGZ13611.1 hypothetical protein PHYSODRAFT_262821 [Phytophthora sojae]|eukprot:XP_009531040.1 hypothetical protein PHYSODRAFT_262821 [Phytophthora sojae]
MTLGLALADPMYTSAGDLQADGSFTKDLRFFSGQKSAMHALRAAGVGVYIIGASPELYTIPTSCFGLGDMVPKENRCDVRFTTDEADASLLNDRTCEFFGTTESGTNNTYLLQGGPSHQYVDHVTCLLAEGFIKNEGKSGLALHLSFTPSKFATTKVTKVFCDRHGHGSTRSFTTHKHRKVVCALKQGGEAGKSKSNILGCVHE